MFFPDLSLALYGLLSAERAFFVGFGKIVPVLFLVSDNPSVFHSANGKPFPEWSNILVVDGMLMALSNTPERTLEIRKIIMESETEEKTLEKAKNLYS